MTRLVFVMAFMGLVAFFGRTSSLKTQALVVFFIYSLVTMYVASNEARTEYAKVVLAEAANGAKDFLVCKRFRRNSVASGDFKV